MKMRIGQSAGAHCSQLHSRSVGAGGQNDLDARSEYYDCENVIVTKYGDWQRVEPFTAAMEIRGCMQVKGYHQERK